MLSTILFISVGVVIVALIVGLIVSVTSRRSLVEERLGKYLEEGEKKEIEKKAERTTITDWVNKRFEKSTIGERIARDLARADLKFKVGEYMALFVISTLGVAFLAFLLGGRNIISALIGAVVGVFLPRVYLKRQQSKRLVHFDEQLPDMINLMVNGLKAGYSILQAMEAVSKELAPPICDEFHRVVQEIQLGIPNEKAMANLLRRIPSGDLDFVITAINVQREVGGNLADILEIISYTIRERVRIKGEIRSLTSQGMYSGRILALMPICLIGILWFINRSYIMEFFSGESLCGIIALIVAGLLIGVGYFVMTRIANIEV